MVRRLLERLQPQRRHLTFLVAALVLTFVLTAVLAHQARRSEIERQRLVQRRLAEVAQGMADNWAGTFQTMVFGELSPVVRLLLPATQDPDAAFHALARNARFCGRCTTDAGHEAYFMQAKGGDLHTYGPPTDSAILKHVWSRADRREFAALTNSFGMGLYMATVAEAIVPVAAFIQLDFDGAPVRVFGAVLTLERAADMLRQSFQSNGFGATLGSSMPTDSLFQIATVSDGRRVMGQVPSTPVVAHTRLTAGPVPGLELYIGLLPAGEGLIVLTPPGTARVPVFGVLLTIITGLIVLALLLVRRETELVRLRADFISGVTHEFRTPLAQIRMFTEMLLLGRARSDVERRRSLEIIDQEAQRLAHLIENTLTYSKTEAGRQRIKPEPLSLPDEVRRAVEIFAPLSRSRQVEIRCELEEQIEASVDPGALRQMLLNVLDNALKYGPSGQRVTVGLALFGEDARVWVDDEGPGIPKVDRERVFEPFFRLRRDASGRAGGSGIGLSVVREIARLHGGSAWAEAAPGGGTRIVMQFPDAYLRGPHDLPAAS